LVGAAAAAEEEEEEEEEAAAEAAAAAAAAEARAVMARLLSVARRYWAFATGLGAWRASPGSRA